MGSRWETNERSCRWPITFPIVHLPIAPQHGAEYYTEPQGLTHTYSPGSQRASTSSRTVVRGTYFLKFIQRPDQTEYTTKLLHSPDDVPKHSNIHVFTLLGRRARLVIEPYIKEQQPKTLLNQQNTRIHSNCSPCTLAYNRKDHPKMSTPQFLLGSTLLSSL